MKKSFFFLVLSTCLLLACSTTQKLTPQEQADKALITQTINNYLEGWMTGDTTLIGGAMHATCQLKNVKDDEVLVFSRSKYLSFFKPRPRRENAGGSVLSIDITRDVAAAKCRIYTADRIYIDYFNMMRIDGRWYIVDKAATNRAKTEAELGEK
ncbi:MAG: nuclear transport factor 2 family protein [Bacteroidota bacterium]